MSTVDRPLRVGWIVDSAPSRAWSFPWQALGPVSRIRYGHVARHIAKTDKRYRIERYLPLRRYDVVVIVKKLNPEVLSLAQRLKQAGTAIIFDSNVNYYEKWGAYDIPGTEPRPDQMDWAARMTSLAHIVVADSSYLADQCRKLNPGTFMIPDAVDTRFYSPANHRQEVKRPIRFIWSGISKKAHHLQIMEPMMSRYSKELTLHLVINRPHPKDPPSPVIDRLMQTGACQTSFYSYESYVEALRQADAIVSPKLLTSAYEMAHTEYKITCGMAVGLPALASPQTSYLEAIGANEGGWLCQTPVDWEKVVESILSDPTLLRQKGTIARQRVEDRYSVPVVAEQYKAVLQQAYEAAKR